MLLYTTMLVISFLVAVPIIILIYAAISAVNKVAAELSSDELIAATGSASVQQYRVKLNYAKAAIRRNQDTARPLREEKLASADGSCNAGAEEVPRTVTLESACKPYKRQASATTVNADPVKKPATRELTAKTVNPGTASRPFKPSFAPRTPNPGPAGRSLMPDYAPRIMGVESASRPWGW